MRISDWSSDVCSSDLVDENAGEPVHQACSISMRVPQKSLGCRNSTGLSWAPILGSPSPSTRAPSPLRRSRAARMSSTRSEEHTSELQSLMRISYAVFCLKKKNATLRMSLSLAHGASGTSRTDARIVYATPVDTRPKEHTQDTQTTTLCA